MRRAPAIGFAVAFAAMLYTHNWALFFGAATGLVWLWLLWRADAAERRRLLRTGLIGLRRRGPALRAVDPEHALPGRPHRGAVGQRADARGAGLGAGQDPGGDGRAGGRARRRRRRAGRSGAAAARRRARGRGAARDRRGDDRPRVAGLAALARLGDPLPRGRRRRRSCCSPRPASARPGGSASPAWPSSPCCGRSTARRTEKSNVREVSEAIAPSLRPGDVVVATQPEQVSALHYYLPDGPALRDAHRLGARRRRDGLARRRRAAGAHQRARATSRPCSTRCRPAAGSRSSCRRSTRSPVARPVDVARPRALGGVAGLPRGRLALRPHRRGARRAPSRGRPTPCGAEVFVRR